MLILGIETATAQVGCAIGGHEGVLALVAVGPRPAPRRDARRRPSSSSAARRAIELDEISVVAVDLGPGLFTGLRVGVATAKAMAHALRVPMIGVPSLDLLAFPVRFTQPARSSRSSTPAGASCSTPSTGRCPAACSG